MDKPSDDRRHFSEGGADAFDRAYGQALGFAHTRESVVTDVGVLGVGGVRQYTVQTFRVPEAGDQVFIWINGPEGVQRVFLPAKVSNAIASQRDSITARTRSAIGRRGGKASQAKRKREGRPAFGK
jgi:hypothetical protein